MNAFSAHLAARSDADEIPSRPCVPPPPSATTHPAVADPRADALDIIGAYLDPIALDLARDLTDPADPLAAVHGDQRTALWGLVYEAQRVLGELRATLGARDTEPGGVGHG